MTENFRPTVGDSIKNFEDGNRISEKAKRGVIHESGLSAGFITYTMFTGEVKK